MIGVQARSGSTRLKGKCSLEIDRGPGSLAGNVMVQANYASMWIGKQAVAVMLVPIGDPIMKKFKDRYEVFEGDELDVLGRYYDAAEEYNPDYIVRLTGDCPWMTSHMIMKCVRATIKYGADYCSNILVRTFMEGLDVEVISRRLLKALDSKVHSDSGREHVTSEIPNLIKEGRLQGFVFHTVLSYYDLSHIKTSIDTREEYDHCNALYEKKRTKFNLAESYGTIST